MNCSRAREIIFLYTDNELGEELLVSLQEHLVLCPQCAQRIDYTRRLLTVVRKGCTRTRAPESLRRRILSSLRQPEVEWEG
jgi:mycothiol system anti-sigma-R factor